MPNLFKEKISESLEQDIRELERRLKDLREQKEKPKPREIVKEYLAEKTRLPLPSSRQTSPAPLDDEDKEILPDYLKKYSDKEKSIVRGLIQTAWQKGIEEATNEARRRGPFIMDAFHDALVDKLYDRLKQRGIL